MVRGVLKIPFLALIKQTKETKVLTSYGYGAQDSSGMFYHKTKYKVLKPLPEQQYLLSRKP
jgi:hypothetical protein